MPYLKILTHLIDVIEIWTFTVGENIAKLLSRKIDVLTHDALKTLRVKEVATAIEESLLYV